MYCPKCGKDLSDNDFNVCPYCGYDPHQQADREESGSSSRPGCIMGCLGPAVILIAACLIVPAIFSAGSNLIHYGSLSKPAPKPAATTSTSASSSSSSYSSYEGYIRANSFVCADMDTLLQLSDALKSSDKELLQQVILSGKAYGIKTRTKATIIPSLVDSNVVSVVIEEGKYDLKEGYTFTSWTESR